MESDNMLKIKPLNIADAAPDNRLSLVALAKQYLKWMEIINYSEATINGRVFDLHYFICWCYEYGIIVVSDVTREVAERYISA